MSSMFQGSQVVATLNAAGLDLATFGNHEFDFGLDVTKQRMQESRFPWVSANVLEPGTSLPPGGADPFVLRDYGGVRVVFFGLLTPETGTLWIENTYHSKSLILDLHFLTYSTSARKILLTTPCPRMTTLALRVWSLSASERPSLMVQLFVGMPAGTSPMTETFGFVFSPDIVWMVLPQAFDSNAT
jgi:hypothetical protein